MGCAYRLRRGEARPDPAVRMDCDLCGAQSEDPAVRQRLVDGWRPIFGHQNYTAENVRCDGCRSDGRVAATQCKARPCAIERGVESCPTCADFACERVRPLLASREGMLIFCRPKDAPVTEAEYALCMRQFESMPKVVRMLVESGKLGGWALGNRSDRSMDG